MTEVTRVRVETPVMHTVRVFEPQPVKVSVLVGGTPLDPADFATAVQGALADTAVQPGDIPIEIWNVETFVDVTYPDNEGIPDQSAVGGPTLVAGDRVYRDDGLIYEIAEGPWTLIHTMVEGDHVQVLWDSYTGNWQPYSSLLMFKNSHGTLAPVGGGYLGYVVGGFAVYITGAVINEADARSTADTALGGRIDDEADARTAADTALSEDITNQMGNEATDRTLADAALSDAIAAAISQEVADRTAAITAAIDALVGDAPGTLDTLVELAAALEGQMADLASLLTLIGTKETPAGAQAKVDIETGNRIAAVSAAIAAAAVDATTKADAAQAAAIAAAAVDATTKANAAVVTAAAAAQVIADAKVEDAIVNGVTTKAPSQNAVYDALALKATTAQGVLADTAVQPAAPATLTNKRITERWAVVAPGVTPALDTDLYDGFLLSGLAAAVTSMTTNLTGTPTQGQQFIAVLSDDGTARAITWDAKFTGSTLPTTTTVGSKTWVGCRWDTAANAFVCLATKVV